MGMKINPIRITIAMDTITIEDWTIATLWILVIGLLIAMSCSLV
jgi:hypothetical protein